MTPIELGWIAGLLEGEGCFHVYWKQREQWRYPTISASCTMSDRDVIARLSALVPEARISGPRAQFGLGTKPTWRWTLQRREALVELLTAIRPLMGERRAAKINELLAIHAEYARPRWKHGTRQGYERGCREACCREPHAARIRDQRARRAA